MASTRKPSALLAHPHALHPAGVYDEFGRELLNAHVVQALHDILGEPLLKLIEHAARHMDDPEHPIHNDLHDAFNGHISGTWRVERFDAPIEYYAARLLGNKGHGQRVSQAEIDAVEYHKLPAEQRVAIDAAFRKAERSYQTTEWDDEFHNLFTTAGVSALWNQCANGGAANAGGAAPVVNGWFNNAQARIGVGDSATAATNAQIDLQAASNRLWVAMDATFPTLPGTGTNSIVFRSTFTSAQANYAWGEFAVDSNNGSNVTTPGSAARVSGQGAMLDRVVSAQGTKASGQTWVPSMTLSIA